MLVTNANDESLNILRVHVSEVYITFVCDIHKIIMEQKGYAFIF